MALQASLIRWRRIHHSGSTVRSNSKAGKSERGHLAVGRTLRKIGENPDVRIRRVAPRSHAGISFVMHLPVIKESLRWKRAVLLEKHDYAKPLTVANS